MPVPYPRPGIRLARPASGPAAGRAAVVDRAAEVAADPGYLLDVPDLDEWQAAHGPFPARSWLLHRTGGSGSPCRVLALAARRPAMAESESGWWPMAGEAASG